MEKGKIITVILVIALIGCGGYIVYKNYPSFLNSGANQPAVSPAGEGVQVYQAPAAQTQAADSGSECTVSGYTSSGEVYATPSAIRSMDLYAEPVDWDSVIGNDGIVIHFVFYDEYKRKVIFSGSSIDCQVDVLSPKTDTLMRTVSPRKVLYKGYTTITSSDQGEGGSLAGIRIAYSDLNTDQYTRGIGQITIKASLPAGGTINAEETFLYTKK